jgi:hypothetical protein
VIYFIRKNGMRHPALARHWRTDFSDGLSPAEALVLEGS